jgi:hypothetical protein
MAQFTAEERYRSGVGYWQFNCDKLGADQCQLAVSVDCGVWRLPAVDSTTGNAIYTEWAAGPRHYDDVKVRFLMNEKSKGLYTMAQDIGVGKNGSDNRFNFTLQFKNVDGGGYMHIDYTDAAVVGQRHLGFVSTAHGEAAEEEISFRSNTAKLVKG